MHVFSCLLCHLVFAVPPWYPCYDMVRVWTFVQHTEPDPVLMEEEDEAQYSDAIEEKIFSLIMQGAD